MQIISQARHQNGVEWLKVCAVLLVLLLGLVGLGFKISLTRGQPEAPVTAAAADRALVDGVRAAVPAPRQEFTAPAASSIYWSVPGAPGVCRLAPPPVYQVAIAEPYGARLKTFVSR